ncbi:nuclear transport factor 2 family protein [Leisingera sp.]|uniref:nuclear transport factor 2 family protein n=1 Tax=Leisingera sp. TaxID=1879318 RepID=UPI003A95703C
MRVNCNDRTAKDCVTDFFSALRQEGIEAALEYVADDATFVAVLNDDFKKFLPMYGEFRGKSGARAFLNSLAENFDTQEFTVHKMISEGEFAALWGRFHHRIRSTGKDFRSDWALTCEIRNGKIVHYQFYEDTAALEDAFDQPSRSHVV